jgi:phosphoglycolate phosphatase
MDRTVVFDLDGTLLNTLDDLADSANYALALLGYSTHPTEKYRRFLGDGVDRLIFRIVPEEGVVPEKLQAMKKCFLDRYHSHALDKTMPYNGVTEVLCALKDAGFRLCVVSNKPDAQAKFTVNHFFGFELFDLIAGGSAAYPLKPDPTLTLHVLASVETPPENAFFVGDSNVDMQTAKNALCTAIGVTWGFRGRGELTANGADHIADTPGDLLEIIERR